jgi:peptide/histidine transporter 3/4
VQVVYNQMNTLFVLQGTTMDRGFFGIQIPAASMSFVNTVAVMICVVIYDQGVGGWGGLQWWRGSAGP